MTSTPPPEVGILDDVLVAELATGIAGPYAGKLFADAGADVVKVEPPGGDPLRARVVGGRCAGGADSALFQHLNAGKRSVVGGPGDPAIEDLVAGADLVIESLAPLSDWPGAWRGEHPQLVVLSITPYGRHGPYRDRPATGFTVQAESGSIGARGRPDGVPVQAGGRIGEWCAGVFGAVGALAAVTRARRTGVGELVDSPWLAADHLATNANVSLRYSLQGRPPLDHPARVVDAPSIERTADGLVGFTTNTRQQFEDFVRMVERLDLLADERWASAEFRMRHIDEWDAMVTPWLLAHTSAEALEAATLLRIPAAPVNNGPSLLDQEHYRVRGVFGPCPGGGFAHPLPPYVMDGDRPRPARPAPGLGEHTHLACGRGRARPAAPDPTGPGLPFTGLRVLDATSMWAGPVVGQVLAALGADVIHLESIQRLDLGRLKVDGGQGRPQWWERGANWQMVNANKRDVTLDLRQPTGRLLMHRLIARCDVLVENFSPRVFEQFGVTKEIVRALNPRTVFARMPAFGLDGPWRDHVGFAQTMEQVSGLAWVTGHPGESRPQVPRGPCDPLAGYHALFAIMVALWRRDRGGGGAFLELAMTESALNAAAEVLIEYSAYGVVLERQGNRGPDAAPQGLYRCGGDDQWLALSVEDDAQWSALRRELGEPPWAAAPDLQTVDGRHAAADRLDEGLATWAAELGLDEAVDRLVRAGVPAAPVRDPRLADGHPQLRAWGYFEDVEHPVAGRHPLPSLPFRYDGVPRWFRSPAPTLGQHNAEVLCDLLGLSAAELAALEEQAVIGTAPLGANPRFDL